MKIEISFNSIGRLNIRIISILLSIDGILFLYNYNCYYYYYYFCRFCGDLILYFNAHLSILLVLDFYELYGFVWQLLLLPFYSLLEASCSHVCALEKNTFNIRNYIWLSQFQAVPHDRIK